jgi:Ser/Thr protein kinase RdoA (MazF antagonist)
MIGVGMKAFEELTRLGRIRRMRQLAQTALEAYGLADARFELLRQAGNTLFRVKARDPVPSTRNDLYEQGQYILRIHQPGYQTTTAIELELSWLAALRRDADLPVQEPVPTLDGQLLVQVTAPGVPGQRNCSLLRWMKGHYLKKDIQPHHYQAQ